ncbi:MAG: cell fate regulator YaaT (PSP1 superfamily) [Cyclobacteriaceae bacterium]|jgi:cell fate regulator YaaT (PSP1 superfamily)
MNVFDWLSNMDMPSASVFNILEVRFKNGRKEFYRNRDHLELTTGDAVVLDVPNGHHIGFVSLQGELVRLQMKKKGAKEADEIRSIYRVASPIDMEKFDRVRIRENPTMFRAREIIGQLKLKMKLTDVEYQSDNSKATFYYSAEDRVDFRELIKLLAGEFKIRVEMRQISLRQEAGRLGGIGSCGRELCCSTWLSEFKTVSTQAARYQNLSLNPSKLSGQCGRLKCCLNYELDTYVDALKEIPKIEQSLQTAEGTAHLQKTDIFKRIMWFGYENENAWYPVDVKRVKEILALNRKGEKPATLVEDSLAEKDDLSSGINSDLIALDRKFSAGTKKTSKQKSRRKNKNNNPNAANAPQSSKP